MQLGSLGTPRDAVDATFDYFGETIRVHPDASDLGFVDMLTRAAVITFDEQHPEQSFEALNMVVTGIKRLIHPDDWDRFWVTALANRQGTLDLLTLSEQITEAVAGFPTGRSSGSRAGRPNTPANSRAGSSSRDTRRALTLLKGRPDLQAAVIRAEEARQSRAG